MNKSMFEPHIGKIVKIDRAGPNSRTGKLLKLGSDFLVLLGEEGEIFYYPFHHIKSVTTFAKNDPVSINSPTNFKYKMNPTFMTLLKNLKSHWIYINKGGPEKLEGILHDCSNNCVVLLNKEEVIRIPIFHIKNISYGPVLPKAENNGEKKK